VRIACLLVAAAVLAGGCGGQDDTAGAGDVSYEQVQGVFEKYGCAGCHPGVVPALDLTEGNSYSQLVGIRAVLDPTLYRVVAGDPGKSFLYLKLGGDPPVADIPAIGIRMPPDAPPIDPEDLALVRSWISQGAKDVDGETKGPEVATPGSAPTGLDVPAATAATGTGTITGTVVDERFKPVAGALVTLLLFGPDEEGGLEHYRVAVTGPGGRFTLPEAPAGSYELKAYGPDTIYVVRIVALAEGETQEVHFGLPGRAVENPTISQAKVAGRELSLTVTGSDIASNYVLAVNPGAGVVFELHNETEAAGTWSTAIDRALDGPWLFLAVDELCNTSEFLTVEG